MIGQNYFLLNVFGLAIGTFLIRLSFIAFSKKMNISDKTRELFTYIPAATFPTLVIPATFYFQGRVEWLMGKERFIILLLSSIACYFIRSTLFVITFGLTILYLTTHFNQ